MGRRASIGRRFCGEPIPLTPALSQGERGPTEVSGAVRRPETPNRLWIQSITFKSVYLWNIHGQSPLPPGEG
ncbi:hypothetical protein RS1P1_37980 [Pseudomonas moraviensis]|nr:hypothetical protein RS1P1_37980 [Pseudomonas moraviensis]